MAQKHEQLAVVAARLARAADQVWACGGRLGQVPDSVTVAEEGYPDTPVDQAEGSCAGVVSAEAARDLGIETVSEVPAGLALSEDCLVHGEGETYYLTASYGPAADDARAPQPGVEPYPATASAACGRGQGRAHYAAEAGEGLHRLEPSDPRAFVEMFERFVAASAERHGCELDEDRPTAGEVRDLAEDLAQPDSADNARSPTTQTVREILPTSDSVGLAGWDLGSHLAETGDQAEVCAELSPGLCQNLRAHVTWGLDHDGDEDRGVDFTVLAYDTEQQAHQAIQAAQDFFAPFEDARDEDYTLLDPADLPHFGEDGMGVSAQDHTQLEEDSGAAATISLFAQGPYVGVLRVESHDLAERWATINELGGILAVRMNETEAGHRPETTNAYGD
ncbi:hypothetical protein [Streptomyces sp. B6B3]|uniref:hypothetical protein n=1 Tax=Streptomyces sp. B6B3 TaxID=3153570 RepID=UPI00325D9036